MSSAILAVYDALAATTVSDGAQEIAARDIDAQPNSLNTAVAPVRILTVIDPLAGTQRARSDTAWGAMGGSGFYKIDWVIYDVLYHTPLFQGRGVMDVNEPLLTYQANYYAMIAGTLALPGGCDAELDDHATGRLGIPVTVGPLVVRRARHFEHTGDDLPMSTSVVFLKSEAGPQTVFGTPATPTFTLPFAGNYVDAGDFHEAALDSGRWMPTTLMNRVSEHGTFTLAGAAIFELLPIFASAGFNDITPTGANPFTYTYHLNLTNPGTPLALHIPFRRR